VNGLDDFAVFRILDGLTRLPQGFAKELQVAIS
jgi:hypothetical protein